MTTRKLAATTLAAWLLAGWPPTGAAQETGEPDADETMTVHGDAAERIAIVPSEPVDAVFGLDKPLSETPRSATSISIETMDRLGMTDIDDLVMLSASSFTQSFFGVSGSLDLRGTSGENYFNGIRRLDNPGNYATPIGAADRVDIVRGPASVIYGPSKIGGYMNFVPKSARADTGQFLPKPTGELTLSAGSWNRTVVAAEVGGPGTLGDRRFGYYLFGEWEDSGSYYRDTATGNVILQATFNVDLSDKVRLLWGGMYHDYDGNEVGGWNRLTQELIDHGTYLTGLAKPLDADGDGFISHAEYDAANGGSGLFAFVVDPASYTGPITPGDDFALDPRTLGTARLEGHQVLVAQGDVLATEDFVFYADLHFAAGPRWQVTNKLYVEGYDHLSEVAYGFAEFADSRVFEDQLIVTFSPTVDWGRMRLLVSPSFRRTDFEHANDFANEHFDRRDLTGPATPRDRRLLATRIDAEYSDYSEGFYSSLGLAALADLDWNNGLNAILGVRQERIDLESRQPAGRTRSGEAIDASDTESVLSWTASLSYRTPIRSHAVRHGVGADHRRRRTGRRDPPVERGPGPGRRHLGTGRVRRQGHVPGRSAIRPGRALRAGTDRFQRAGHRHQPGLPREGPRTRVALAGDRAAVRDRRLHRPQGGQPQHPRQRRTVQLPRRRGPARHGPGNLLRGDRRRIRHLASNPDAVRAGVPKHLAAVTALYERDKWRMFASVADVASVYSGFSQRVRLPAYTLLNAGLRFDGRRWSVTVSGKNLTDERYFRANFPNLFGGVVVLPELPRHFQATVAWKF